jgi:hypothetical protein
MVKCRHEVGSDLSRLLFGYRIEKIFVHQPQRGTPKARHRLPRLDTGIAQPTWLELPA